MSVAPHALRQPIGRAAAQATRWLAAAAAAVVLGSLIALALYRNPPSLLIVLAAGIALIASLSIALARYDYAIGLGILLLGVVKIEPAPTDAVIMIAIAVAIVTRRFDLSRVPPVVAGVVGIYLFLNVLAMTQVVDMARAVKFSFITFYLALFGLWLASWAHGRGRVRLIVRAYVAAAVSSAVLGSVALVIPVPGRSILTVYNVTRAVALFKDPNVFGAFLVPAALILIDEILSPSLLRSRRLVKGAMAIVVMVGVVFSFSRAAWIGLILGVLVMLAIYALRRGGGRNAAVLVGVAVTAASIVAITLAATGSIGFIKQRAHFQTYDTARFGNQETGLRLVQQHPIGIGPGQFEVAEPLSAHSTYVRALSEVGFLGLASVLSLMLATFILGARNAVLGRDTYGLRSAPLLGAWCGLLVSGFVIDTLHWRHLWLVAALIWAGAMRRPGSD